MLISLCLQQYIERDNKQYGDSFSVQKAKNEKPLMMIVQDKSTCQQLTFSKKYWKGPNDHSFIVPKSIGKILMVSGFQLREFGLCVRAILTI